jgi:hypothetical protein
LKNKEIKGVKMKLSEKDEFARDIVSEKEMVSATISICSDYGKRYEFKKPSFTYDYLYINDDGYVYGRVYNDIQKVWKEKKWNKETGKVYGSGDATYFNLVPVKQESDVDDIDVVNIAKHPKQVSKNTFTVTEVKSDFESKLYEILGDLHEMLVDKNRKYGNSALEPKRIFSKMNSIEQLKVRIDDKLSRISNQNMDEDEDVVDDLLGYLVLYKIAKAKEEK